MKQLLLVLALTHFISNGTATAQTRFFARETPQESKRIALTIEGGQVNGSQIWQPKGEHGSRGSLSGIITGGGIIQVVHDYEIEGSNQSEEEVLRLDGDKLFIGQGELVPGKDGRMNLKEPNKVAFKTELREVVARAPAEGSPEHLAVVEALRAPVTAHIGQPVTFKGTVRQAGSWARFQGNVSAVDAKAPRGKNADELEMDFFALLRAGARGKWEAVHWGFSGDISVREAAREKYPEASWILFE